jgi:hypothetical protein
MVALSAAHPIPLCEIFVDLDWNTRSRANTTTVAASETDPESAGLEGLALNILRTGQSTPVDVRATTPPFYAQTSLPYALVCGFRRVTALEKLFASEQFRSEAAAAGRTIVPGLPDGCVLAVNHGPLSEKDAFLLNAKENGNREGLTAPDTAMMVKRGIEDHKLSIGDLALQLGKTPASIAAYVKVTALPPEILNHWVRGGEFEGKTGKRVGIGDMIAIAKLKLPEDQLKGYRRALETQEAREATSAWEVRAKQRAAASGALLAKLEKHGFVAVLGRDWAGRAIWDLAGLGKRNASADQFIEFANAAQAAYEREMQKTDRPQHGHDTIAVPQSQSSDEETSDDA